MCTDSDIVDSTEWKQPLIVTLTCELLLKAGRKLR